jgi:RNA polymerase sigma-70 factor (ECF subfamily)
VQRDLVIQAQHGDAGAFEALASEAIGRLHGIAFRILRDRDRADDATQQALVATWSHLRDLRDPDRFDAWTYRLVVNAAYRQARRESTRCDVVRWLVPDEQAEPDLPDAIAERDQIEHAFRSLSPEHRAVLALRYYADLPMSEIAEILDIPLGTVGSRLHHATRRMRDSLERDRHAAPLARQAAT